MHTVWSKVVLPRIIADHLGSVRVVLNEQGNVDSWSDYYPFGKESRGSSTSNEPKEQFTGKERDIEIGLDYFGARYYNYDVARFMTIDPLIQKYPHWSPYVYAGNMPVRFVDVDGKGPGESSVGQPIFLPVVIPILVEAAPYIIAGVGAIIGYGVTQVIVDNISSTSFQPPGIEGTQTNDLSNTQGFPISTAVTDNTTVSLPTNIDNTNVTGLPIDQGIQSTTTLEIKSPNQLNKEIAKGSAPNGISRVDIGKTKGEQTHVHIGKGNALNIDGTWKHGGKKTLTNSQKNWLQENGWKLPGDEVKDKKDDK